MASFLFPEESYRIRGAIFDVWNSLGGMHKESVIDHALAISFTKRGLAVRKQVSVPITYDGQKVGMYIPDFIIDNVILLELKSKPEFTLQDRRQFWYYLKGSNFKLGFLVNFGITLEIVRRVYDTARRSAPR